jgi:uncharacterized oxidoreductase
MPNIQSDTLTAFITRTFQTAGAPPDHAELVARTLVAANLTGHDSHGVIRTVQYLTAIQNGHIDPTADPSIVQARGAVTHMDGNGGFGQVGAQAAITQTIHKAKEHSLAATGLFHAGHVGRLGEWVQMAANEQLIGLGFCNGGTRGGLVAPHGGAERRLGTNPFSAAIPQDDGPPILIDFATSVIAEGKVRVARNQGKELPPGCLLNANGYPSVDPHDLYAGGMLRPLGGHKGFCLSLLMDFMGGLLTGHGAASLPGYDVPGNGVLFLALDIEAFRPLGEFYADSNLLTEQMRSTKPAPNSSEVLLPGEPEQRSARQRRESGIPLDETTWEQITAAAAEWGVDAPAVG